MFYLHLFMLVYLVLFFLLWYSVCAYNPHPSWREEVRNNQKYSHYVNAVWHGLIISNSNVERLRFNMLSISLRRIISILHSVWATEFDFCDAADVTTNSLSDQFISFVCIIHKKREHKYKWHQGNIQIELSDE